MCILLIYQYIAFTVDIFDYEISCVRACNSALHVVNVKAHKSARFLSRVLVLFSSWRCDHLLRNFRTRNCARWGGQRSARYRGNNMRRLESVVSHGKGTMDKINGKWGECRATPKDARQEHAEEWLCIICLAVISEIR